jgi:plastocyanin
MMGGKPPLNCQESAMNVNVPAETTPIQPGDTVAWGGLNPGRGTVAATDTHDGALWADITVHTPGQLGTTTTTLPGHLLTHADTTPIQPGDTVTWIEHGSVTRSGTVDYLRTPAGRPPHAAITVHTPGQPGTTYTALPLTLLTRIAP